MLDATNQPQPGDESETGGDFLIPGREYFGSDTRTDYRCNDRIRNDESKSLNFFLGGELEILQESFTKDLPHDMNIRPGTIYTSCPGRRKGSPGYDAANQLSLFAQAHEIANDAETAQESELPPTADDDQVNAQLRVVPPIRDAAVTPLASIYHVRELSAYPALYALSIPNANVRVDLRQAEREAALLRYSEFDPALIEKIVGTHAKGTIAAYNNQLNHYGRFAATKGQPTAPVTAYIAALYLLQRAEEGSKFPQLVRMKDALSAGMKMLGIEPCLSDPLVRDTMRSIGREKGRRHDGRATPFMVRDLRKALPWIEKVAETEPDRALTYLLILSFGMATMLRREELVSVQIGDLIRTRCGFKVAVFKTKTRLATEPPTYIDLERVHDERICPVRILDEYIQRYDFTAGPLFRRMLADGCPGESAMDAACVVKHRGRDCGFSWHRPWKALYRP